MVTVPVLISAQAAGVSVDHVGGHTPAHLHADYNLYFVAISYGLAALGSFAALAGAHRIPENRGGRRLAWSAVTALALGGGGIWSMHFVGMVAYHIDLAVSFDLRITLLSLLIAVTVSGVGIWLVAEDPSSTGRLIGGGTFAGLGIATMHYTGMAAMQTGGEVSYDRTLVALSIGIAVIAAVAAFWIAFHVGGTHRVLGASLVMATAVCGMHYTAMAATRVTAGPLIGRPAGFDPPVLGLITAFVSTIALILIIVTALGGDTDPEFMAERAKVEPGTLRVYRSQGRLPPPDDDSVPDRPRRRRSTFEAWMKARPGAGARTDLRRRDKHDEPSSKS